MLNASPPLTQRPNLRRAAGVAVAAALGLAALYAPAQAQQQPAMAPGAQTAQQPNPEPWVKLCNQNQETKKETCVVTQELRDGNTGVLLAAASIMEEGDKRVFVISLPPGLLIEPGLRVQIDKSEPKPAKFTICFPRACMARTEIPADFVKALKAGSELLLFGLNQEQKSVGIKLTLSGFTKAYDGPPTDTAAYQAAQKQLMEQLQKRAEERRTQQGQAPAGQTAPAPAPPQ